MVLFRSLRKTFNSLKIICELVSCQLSLFSEHPYPPTAHSSNTSNTLINLNIPFLDNMRKITDLHNSFGPPHLHPNASREARQIGSGLFLGSLFSVGLGFYTIHELQTLITDIQTNQATLEGISLTVNKQADSIQANEDNIRLLQTILVDLVNKLNETHILAQLEEAELYFTEVVRVLNDWANGILSIILHKTFTTNLFDAQDLKDMQHSLIVKAASKNLQLTRSSWADLLKGPISYVYMHHQLNIILHVPLMGITQFKLYQFTSSIIPLGDGSAVEISSDEQFLAVTSEEDKSFTMSSEVFNKCKSYRPKYYVCGNPVISIGLKHSCLALIYSGDFHSLLNKCHTHITTAKTSMTQITDTSIILYLIPGDTADMICDDSEKSIRFMTSGHQIVNVMKNCRMVIADAIFYPQYNTAIRTHFILRPMAVPPVNSVIIDKLKPVNYTLVHVPNPHRIETSVSVNFLPLIVLTTILACFITSILIITIYHNTRRCRWPWGRSGTRRPPTSRRSSAPSSPPPPPPLNVSRSSHDSLNELHIAVTEV